MLHSLYIPFQFFHPPIWRGFLSLYSQSNCILALRLYSQGASIGCLSHQSFAGGGRVYCELWDYCLRVTSLLMWLVELVQCIECGGDSYFTWIFSFFFTCTSLPSSSVSCASGLLNTSQDRLTYRAPQGVGLFVLPPRILIRVLG